MWWRLKMKIENAIEAVLTFGLKKCEKCGFKILNYSEVKCPLCGANTTQWTKKEIFLNFLGRFMWTIPASCAGCLVGTWLISKLLPH